MNKQHSGGDPFDNLFDQAQQELANIGSALPDIQKRIALTPMRSARRAPPWPLAAAVLLSILVLVLLLHSGWWPAIRPNAPGTNQHWTEVSRLDIDGVELTTHLATVIDDKAVLVLWSVRHGELKRDASDRQWGLKVGNYRRYMLPQCKRVDGLGMYSCLYVPERGAQGCLEPPMVLAQLAGGRTLGLGISPQALPPGGVAGALKSAGLGARSGITAEDVRHAIEKCIY